MLKLGAAQRPRRLRDLKNLPNNLKSCPIFRDILSYALQMSHRGPIVIALAAASAYHHPDRYPHDVRTNGDFLKHVCLRNLLAVANNTLHCLARGRSHFRHLSSWGTQDASQTGSQRRNRTTLRGSPSPRGRWARLPEAFQPAPLVLQFSRRETPSTWTGGYPSHRRAKSRRKDSRQVAAGSRQQAAISPLGWELGMLGIFNHLVEATLSPAPQGIVAQRQSGSLRVRAGTAGERRPPRCNRHAPQSHRPRPHCLRGPPLSPVPVGCLACWEWGTLVPRQLMKRAMLLPYLCSLEL